MRAAFFLLLGAAVACAQPASKDVCTPPPSGVAPSLPAKILPGQGHVHLAITTTNPKAQEFFDQGLAQLHSFWATEAERSFRQAAELDPDAPMPQWGIAMVASGDYRPRFQLDLYAKAFGKGNPLGANKRADDAAQRATELAAASGKATDLEKMYVASIAARRDRKIKDREEAYTSGLRAIVAKYPDEVEAKLFLALHLMRGFELPDKTPHLTSMEAVSILRGLLITAPEHPGVHHYVIHGFEGSSFAKEAWASCAKYPELVPGIPHALHMPGHIYSQTGRWGDAAASFSDAAAVERRYMSADKLYGSGHHGHNVHYLATALSFEGQYDKAKAAATELLALGENPREKASLDGFFASYRQGWFAMLRTLVQSESWDEILDGKSLPVYDKPREQAWRHWALSLAHANKSQVDAAREESHLMDAALKDYRDQVKAGVPEALQTARAELDGHLKIAEGSIDAGLKKLDQASRMELKMDYSEPPFYPRPVSEAMGQAALRNGRAAEAKACFERALRQYPASHRAQQGLKALEARAGGGS
ncbi:MAG: hypothetical protein M3O35_12890 [Acidobacteriota bacterium]|nr:hypothetical protein [Acidobacteriota bacterium]